LIRCAIDYCRLIAADAYAIRYAVAERAALSPFDATAPVLMPAYAPRCRQDAMLPLLMFIIMITLLLPPCLRCRSPDAYVS